MNIENYWKATLAQDADAMRTFFHRDAYVNWHNTNEHFAVEDFLRVNCEYPGRWDGEIERTIQTGDLLICVVHVFSTDGKLSFHVTSFLKIKEGKITSIDEYWGEDGQAPQWRIDQQIGTPIS